ncbi:MAG: LPS-assembly protein LptD [Candidatus Omnitrophota bacterium]|nr:MAG: LPS-assembly protein LptD [Candidatus Omnitrophota bacterium]
MLYWLVMIRARIIKYIRFFLIITIILSQLPTIKIYAQNDLFGKIKNSEEPVIVKGDKVEYFRSEKKVEGVGNVSIKYGDMELKCDRIIVYTDTKEAICEGNVKISQPGASMEGEKINYNFSTKRGYAIKSGIKASPIYGVAEEVSQTGDEKFELKKGYVTTCDLEKPHYSIRAKEVQIFLNRKVVAKHVSFFVGNVPIFYMPLYVQPLLEKRPEVTIVPGRTSDWGYYALTAWRYYFNDKSKGHVHFDYREKKGLAEGIDYKYNSGELGKGIARFYYAHENDDLTVNKSGPSDDRWRMQYKHTIDLPEDTMCTMEFNKLSDRDFIKDYIYREYEENPSVDNYILLETAKPNYIMTLLARKRIDDFFTVVERLPEFKLEVNNQRLWNTNYYYFSEDSITNFIKRYDDDAEDRSRDESVRIDGYHKLSYAGKFFKFLYLTPFIATRQTFYTRNRWKETSQLRSIYEQGFDISAKFYRLFDISSNILDLDLHGLRHIITPNMGFLHRHQPTISTDNLHQFDAIDNIERYNGFTFSLENKLQTKRSYGEGMKAVDLATLIISTDYLFRLEKRNFMPDGNGGFGDLRFDFELRPYTWFSIDSDMILDHKDRNVNSANIDVFVDMGKKFTLGMGHRYESIESGTTSQLTAEIFYNINDDWKIKAYERYDFSSQKWEEQEYTIIKDLHCWLAELSLEIKDGDYSTWLVFRLKAFPNIPLGLFRTTYRRPHTGRE